MTKFEYMNFTGGNDTEFVAHANKYSKEQTIDFCIGENDWHFEDDRLRLPTIEDIEERTVKYFASIPEDCGYDGDGGCYTYCNKGARGSFPVWTIDFAKLK